MNLGDIILKECPESFISDFSQSMITLFHMCYSILPTMGGLAFIGGPLPSPGGIWEQENKVMEAFQIIKAEIGKKE
jgi:hypothetical protein